MSLPEGFSDCNMREKKEQEFTFDDIQQYYILYDKNRLYYDKEHCLGAGTYARVYPGYIIQRMIDE